MKSKKTLQVIESVKNMSDTEAYILEVFIAGFKAGSKNIKNEINNQQYNKAPETA